MTEKDNMDLTNFEKFKESEHYIVYLTKDRKDKKQIEIVVQFKRNNTIWRSLLNDQLFKLFFEPEEYKRIYMKNNEKQK